MQVCASLRYTVQPGHFEILAMFEGIYMFHGTSFLASIPELFVGFSSFLSMQPKAQSNDM